MGLSKIAALATLTFTAFVWGCGGGDDAGRSEIDLTLDDASARLEKLEADLERMQEQIANGDESVSAELKRAMDELEFQLVVLGDDLEHAARQSAEDWDEVREEMAENLDDLERKVEKTRSEMGGSI